MYVGGLQAMAIAGQRHVDSAVYASHRCVEICLYHLKNTYLHVHIYIYTHTYVCVCVRVISTFVCVHVCIYAIFILYR